MSSNPFSEIPNTNPYSSSTPEMSGLPDGYVKQLPIIGILNIVQASLELVMGIGLGGVGIFMSAMSNDPKFTEELSKSNLSPQVFTWIYIGIGIAISLLGLMRLVSGIMTLRKRGRVFSLVTSILGLATVFTCYCAPTAIALAVYTLVVLIQPSVIAEYERAKQS
jgi:ABC-type branched-subunit amino acid transport system permease subunit